MNSSHRIAVVGAGMAGISAASTLADAGATVTLFDRTPLLAGRLGALAGSNADLGAQYFTARDGAFRHALQSGVDAGWVTVWTPRLFRYDAERGLQPSDDAIERWVATPNMATLASRLLAERCPVHDSHTLSLHRTADRQWLAQGAAGDRHGPFDSIVIATAPADALPLLNAAPQLAKTVEHVRMRPAWTLQVSFSNPLATPIEACFVRDGPLDWIAHDSSKPGRQTSNVWVLQSTASWAEQHEGAAAAAVTTALLDAMAAVLDIALPSGSTKSYYWPQARPAEDYKWGALAAPDMGLYLCGDWCFGGRVENAWLSGRQAARALLES